MSNTSNFVADKNMLSKGDISVIALFILIAIIVTTVAVYLFVKGLSLSEAFEEILDRICKGNCCRPFGKAFEDENDPDKYFGDKESFSDMTEVIELRPVVKRTSEKMYN
jgi:hypothetical protein